MLEASHSEKLPSWQVHYWPLLLSPIIELMITSFFVYFRFGPALRICLGQICGYRQLIIDVESIRKIPYSSDNQEHELLLMQVIDCFGSFGGSSYT